MTDVFSDMITDLLDDDNMAVDAVYTPSGGSPLSCRVFFERERYFPPGGFSAENWTDKLTVEGLLADFGGEPLPGSTFVIGEVTYTMTTDDPENDNMSVKVTVK